MTNPPFKPEDLTESLREAIGEAVSGATNWWTASLENLPKPFGHTHLSGANPQKDALLAFAAISYFNSHGDFSDETAEERTAREAELQAANRFAAQAFIEARGLSPLEAMQATAAFGEALADKDSSLEEAAKKFASENGISLSNDDLAQLDALYQKLLAEEARQRDAALANAANATKEAENDTSGPAAQPVAGLLDEKALDATLAGVDKVFDAGQAAGYPVIPHDQRTLVKACFVQEYASANGWDNDYMVARGVTAVVAYGGATFRTGAAALEDAYIAYKEAKGEWSREQWFDALKNKSSAAWDELKRTIGKDGAENYQKASQCVSQRTIEEMSECAGFAIENAETHLYMRGNDPLYPQTLQFIHDDNPELYRKLAGDVAPDKAVVTYAQLTSLIEEPTKRYNRAMTLTDIGASPDEGGVPINLNMVSLGDTPISAINTNAGVTYPSDKDAAAKLGAIGTIESGQNANQQNTYALAQQQQKTAHSMG